MTPTEHIRATAYAVAYAQRMAAHGTPTSAVDSAGVLVTGTVDARHEATAYAHLIAAMAVEGWER